MKKSIILITVLSTFIISGCTQTKDVTITHKEFTEEQNEILTLTGNRAFKYDLKNLNQDKDSELKLVYEVYKNKEKIDEIDIMVMGIGAGDDVEDSNLSISIQDNKIRIMCVGAYTSVDVEENISNLSNYYFTGSQSINIDDEVYLFHGFKGNSAFDSNKLGSISQEEINRFIEENEVNVFIKLVCE